MRDVQGGDVLGGMGWGGLASGGSWMGLWVFAFLIIFFIVLIFLWRRHGEEGSGVERLLPFLGLMKGNDCKHTELVKDQAVDTGKIIHDIDVRSCEIKQTMDHNTRFLEKNIDSFRYEQEKERTADLRAQLVEEKTKNAICKSHDDLKGEIVCLKDKVLTAPPYYPKGGWYEASACRG